MTSEELIKADARDRIIKAAIRLSKSISEEQMHEMASTLDYEGDRKASIEFAASMIDLAQAVQDYEA